MFGFSGKYKGIHTRWLDSVKGRRMLRAVFFGPIRWIEIDQTVKHGKGELASWLTHEMAHIKQGTGFRNWLHPLKYQRNPRYRYECELEAFAAQLKAFKADKLPADLLIYTYANYLRHQYNLPMDLTINAEQDLKDLV